MNWVVAKFSNENVFTDALDTSAIVCEGEEGEWNSATKAFGLVVII